MKRIGEMMAEERRRKAQMPKRDLLTDDERRAVEYWRAAGLKRGDELLVIIDRIAPKP